MRAHGDFAHLSRPSFTRMALSGLRKNRRAYRTLALGIFLSIFFVSAMFTSLYSLLRASEARYREQTGAQDAIVYHAQAVSPAFLLENGLARQAGSLYVVGMLSSESLPNAPGVAVGQMDETAQALLQPACAQGRLPARPGEIAMEASALKRLGLGAQTGARVSLNFAPSGAQPFAAEYTLVGVLEEQSAFIHDGATPGASAYPGALLFAAEPFPSGAVPDVHRVLSLPEPSSFLSAVRSALRDETPQAVQALYEALARQGISAASVQIFSPRGANSAILLTVLALGLSMAACAWAGIASAFSALLGARLNQVGMLRALGATRRQVRRLFSCEALILFALCAPAALALSCAVARLAAGTLYLSGALILAILLLSALGMLLFLQWPLRHALRVSPMQAVRDAQLLRAHRHIRVKSCARFRAPALITRRFLRLYASRSAGVSLLLALSLASLACGCLLMEEAIRWSASNARYAFFMDARRAGGDDPFFDGASPESLYTAADALEIAALPFVERADGVQRTVLGLEIPRATDYLLHCGDWDFEYLREGGSGRENYLRRREELGISGELMDVSLYAWPEENLRALEEFVLAGVIDENALSAGEEVLLLAPEAYQSPMDGNTYANDLFSAGSALAYWHISAQGNRQGGVRVGALLSGVPDGLAGPGRMGDLLTTHAGLAAMGLSNGRYEEIGVLAEDGLTEEGEEILQGALEDVALRVAGGYVDSRAALAREHREAFSLLMAGAGALLALFTVLMAAMLNSAVSGRVRADHRTIAMLRAVGASPSAIREIYARQVCAVLRNGFLLGGVLALALLFGVHAYRKTSPSLALRTFLLLLLPYAAITISAVAANLRARLRAALRPSIAEGIREL